MIPWVKADRTIQEWFKYGFTRDEVKAIVEKCESEVSIEIICQLLDYIENLEK